MVSFIYISCIKLTIYGGHSSGGHEFPPRFDQGIPLSIDQFILRASVFHRAHSRAVLPAILQQAYCKPTSWPQKKSTI